MDRRKFFGGAAATAMSMASVSKVAMAALPEPVMMMKPDTAPPLVPQTGRPYNPVVTLNGWTLPWRMNSGVKEFHLVAEPVVREIAPGMKATLWGYNGQTARAHHHALAWPALAQRYGRRGRLEPEANSGRKNLRL
jgi:manganese oxidase